MRSNIIIAGCVIALAVIVGLCMKAAVKPLAIPSEDRIRDIELSILALERRLDNLPAAVDYTERLKALESRPKAQDYGSRIKALEEQVVLMGGIEDKLIAAGRKSNEQTFKELVLLGSRIDSVEKKVGTACKALNDFVNQSRFGSVDSSDLDPGRRPNRKQSYKSKQQDIKDLQQ